jgi:hypothetical protein
MEWEWAEVRWWSGAVFFSVWCVFMIGLFVAIGRTGSSIIEGKQKLWEEEGKLWDKWSLEEGRPLSRAEFDNKIHYELAKLRALCYNLHEV